VKTSLKCIISLTEETNTSPSGRRARSSEPFTVMIVTNKYFVIILFTASLFMHAKEKESEASAKHAGVGDGMCERDI